MLLGSCTEACGLCAWLRSTVYCNEVAPALPISDVCSCADHVLSHISLHVPACGSVGDYRAMSVSHRMN